MTRQVAHRALSKPFAVLPAALMALYFVPFLASPAQADDVRGFEIEGNLVDDSAADPPIDWFDLGPGSPGFNSRRRHELRRPRRGRGPDHHGDCHP